MTGASEQKLKCILWEIATNDFDFRYDFLNPRVSYGECSRLEDKNKVFKALKEQIIRLSSKQEPLKEIFNKTEKLQIFNKATCDIIGLLNHSTLVRWQEKQFNFFSKESKKLLSSSHFCNYSSPNLTLLEKAIEYDRIVLRHRNRCAHNLKSYQINLPDLSTLVSKDYDYENYFFRFSILILLDEIFMKIYSEYLGLLA